MNAMVSDTSVLIDLERGAFLELCFRLPWNFTVPDLLYETELGSQSDSSGLGETLLALGLEIAELSGAEVSQAIQYRRRKPALSVADSFAFSLAVSRVQSLLTGDAAMRSFAESIDLAYHGVLWVLDQILEANIATAEQMVSGITAIAAHPRCKLPQNEITARMKIYSSQKPD